MRRGGGGKFHQCSLEILGRGKDPWKYFIGGEGGGNAVLNRAMDIDNLMKKDARCGSPKYKSNNF